VIGRALRALLLTVSWGGRRGVGGRSTRSRAIDGVPRSGFRSRLAFRTGRTAGGGLGRGLARAGCVGSSPGAGIGCIDSGPSSRAPPSRRLVVAAAGGDRAEAMDESDGRFERMREARAIGRKLDQVLELDPMQVEGLVAAIEYHRDAPRIAGGREERSAVPAGAARRACARPGGIRGLPDALNVRGRLAEALEAIDSAIVLDSTNPPAWRDASRNAAGTSRAQVAVAIEGLEGLVAAHPEYAPAWFELGRWIASSDDRNGARHRGAGALRSDGSLARTTLRWPAR
jgi:hypothetical protein